jgi:hypothetical protein
VASAVFSIVMAAVGGKAASMAKHWRWRSGY